MAYNRYLNRPIRLNNEEFYEEFFTQRGIRQLNQYLTPNFPKLTTDRKMALETVDHVWKVGDKLYKLAAKYYGDSTLWWLIAWYNEQPTEAHYTLGQIVYIPLPLGRVLSYYNRSVQV